MPLADLFRLSRRAAAVHATYAAVVERARSPRLLSGWGIPDTLDGRYELLALHAFLVLNRLKAEHARTSRYAQALFDTMFADLDRALREMGASDIGIGRHVKTMARGFYGRIVAYERGLAAKDEVLEEALARNLFATAANPGEGPARAAHYVRRQAAALRRAPVDRILAGEVPFEAIEGEDNV